MPQVQVFSIAIPLQVLLGFMVMAASISAALLWFLGRFQDNFQGRFLIGG